MKSILISDLTKTYGSFTAVDHLNLEIEEGQLFALLGTNGAGKTTLLKMLSCLTPPTSGDAHILGDSILGNPQAIKKKMNISPQETAVAGNLSVYENLVLIARLYGLDKKASKEQALAVANQFRLGEVLQKKAKTLSGGMQRRLSIALALISKPDLLFLDEPTLGLDILSRRELWESIKTLKGKITIILTTHYLDEVEELADRIAVMTAGQLVALGTLQELTAQTNTKRLEDAFVHLVGGA